MASPRIPPLLQVAPTGSPIGIEQMTSPLVWRGPDGSTVGWSGRYSGRGWIHLNGTGLFGFDLRDGAVSVVRQPGVARDALWSAFAGTVLPQVLQVRGTQVLHASAVSHRGRLIAISGPSGTGKSTLAAALARRRAEPWADDAVAFAVGQKRVEVFALPFHLRLKGAALDLFHPAKDRRDAPPEPDVPPTDRVRQLSAIFLLHRGLRLQSSEPVVRIEEIAASRAYPRLLEQAYCFDPGDRSSRDRLADEYLQLVGTVPLFDLRIVDNLDRLDEVAERIVSSLSSLPG